MIALRLYKHLFHVIFITTLIIREVFFSVCLYFFIGFVFIALVQMQTEMRRCIQNGKFSNSCEVMQLGCSWDLNSDLWHEALSWNCGGILSVRSFPPIASCASWCFVRSPLEQRKGKETFVFIFQQNRPFYAQDDDEERSPGNTACQVLILYLDRSKVLCIILTLNHDSIILILLMNFKNTSTLFPSSPTKNVLSLRFECRHWVHGLASLFSF